MKRGILKQVISLGLTIAIGLSSIPSNLVYAASENLKSKDVLSETETTADMINSIKVSKNTMYREEGVDIVADLKNTENIESVWIYYSEILDSGVSMGRPLYYNSESKKFEGGWYHGGDEDVKYNFSQLNIELKNGDTVYIKRDTMKNNGFDVTKLDIQVIEWKPTIKSINISNKDIHISVPNFNKSNISVETGNDEEIGQVSLYYERKDDENPYDRSVDLCYDSETGKLESEEVIFDSSDIGKFKYMRIFLKGYSYCYIDIKREDLPKYGFDTNYCDINIKSIKFPIQLKLDKQEVTNNDEVKISASLDGLEDKFKNINIVYASKDIYSREYTSLIYNKETKLYEGKLKISKMMPSTSLYIDNLEVYDNNGESFRIYEFSEEAIQNSNIKINSNIREQVSNINVTTNKKIYEVGEKVKISINGLENFIGKVDYGVSVNLKNTAGFGGKSGYAYYNKKTKVWEILVDVDTNMPGGSWIVENINIWDENNDNLCIYDKNSDEADELYGNSYVKDLSSSIFTIKNNIKDEKAPIFKSIRIDKKEASYGEKITVSVDAIDEVSGIRDIQIIYRGKEELDDKLIDLYYNPTTKKYEGYINIYGSSLNNTYEIDHIYLCDYSDNSTYICTKNCSCFYSEDGYDLGYDNTNVDLSSATFKIVNTSKIDDEVVTYANSNIKYAYNGNTVNFEVKLKNRYGIDTIQIVFRNYGEDGYYHVCDKVNLKYDKSTNSYKGSVRIDKNSLRGLWDIREFAYYNDETGYITTSFPDKIENLKFEVLDEKNSTSTIISNKVDKSKVTQGEKVTLTVEATDKNKTLKKIIATYKTPNNKYKTVELIKNDNKFVGSIDIEEYSPSGTWIIENLILEDTSNNRTKISNTSEFNVDFNLSKFEVYNTKTDNTLPELVSIDIDNKFAILGDKVKVTIKAKDTSSGIKSIKSIYRNLYSVYDIEYTKPIDFKYNNSNDCFEYTIDTGKPVEFGIENWYQDSMPWIIDSLVIEDNAGNVFVSPKDDELVTTSSMLHIFKNKEWFVNEIDTDSTYIDGYIQSSTYVSVNIDGKDYEAVSDKNGYFKIDIPKQVKGKSLKLNVLTFNKKEVIRTFNLTVKQGLVSSNTIPEIKANDVYLKLGNKFDPKNGVTASDKEDGNLTSKIKVVENTVNTQKAGVYKVVYQVEDSAGSKVKKEIKVTIYELAVPKASVKTNTYNSNKISWNKASGANGYEVWRSTSKNGTYKSIKTITSGSTLSYTNTSLATGTTYYYKVRAYRTVNGKKVYSNYSGAVSAKPVLSTPSVTLTSGSKKATVKWKNISGASGYEVYRASSKSGKYTKVKTITKGSTVSYTNSSLTKKKTYYYKVRAYRLVNGKKVYSSYSSIKYVKTK